MNQVADVGRGQLRLGPGGVSGIEGAKGVGYVAYDEDIVDALARLRLCFILRPLLRHRRRNGELQMPVDLAHAF